MGGSRLRYARQEPVRSADALDKDGFDIPFETFLGFKGDKEPDIDLNFSGDYQSESAISIRRSFSVQARPSGREPLPQPWRNKTAFGYVKNYYEERGDSTSGTVRLTGSSSGCVECAPFDSASIRAVSWLLSHGRRFTPLLPFSIPHNDMTTDIITTHFDYHSIDHNLLKLDILGHDDPVPHDQNAGRAWINP
ncbi:MAG: hypothetical protein ACLTS1_07985 [Coprococcus sp.]